MIASGYTLDLYCDAKKHKETFRSPHAQFSDELKSACWKRARLNGWRLSEKTGKAICPACLARKAAKKAARGQAQFIADIRQGPRARQRAATRRGVRG